MPSLAPIITTSVGIAEPIACIEDPKAVRAALVTATVPLTGIVLEAVMSTSRAPPENVMAVRAELVTAVVGAVSTITCG